MSEYMKELRDRIGTSLLVLPSATGLVRDGDGRVLLVKHVNGGIWVLPGGAVDPDESPQDAVVREVWEETGIWVEPVALRGVFGGPEYRVRYDNGDQVSYVMSVFECRRLGGSIRADGEETLEAGYYSVCDLETLNVAGWVRTVLPSLLSREGQTRIPPVTWRPPGPELGGSG